MILIRGFDAPQTMIQVAINHRPESIILCPKTWETSLWLDLIERAETVLEL